MLKQVMTAASPQQVWEPRLCSPMFILDVRNRDEYERWRVEGPQLNRPGVELHPNLTRELH
ncbi:MAG: hypothetical protein B7Y21_11130 [Hydrogenophilales bacterium 16-61-112]|nr:MAG: hypothetical protein B7Y21_11130 [Hydrogenophilales bacterium 16-61-112]